MTEEIIIEGENIDNEYSLETSYFAKVVDGIVVDIIVASEHFVRTQFIDNTPGRWIETKKDGSIRKNFASNGHLYNASLDMFHRRQPYPSWTLNAESGKWEAPVAIPDLENPYDWNEEDQAWVEAVE